MTEPRLKAAVVGVGHFGGHHARIYSQMPLIDLVAVVDADGERAAQIAATTGAKSYQDYHQILNSVDLVSVVTPPESHLSVARDFLSSGTAVLVEKPMAASLNEAEELVRVAKRAGLPLQVGYVNRFTSLIRKVRELHINPAFLEVHRLNAFNFRSADQGVVLDMMIHDIDLILMLVGQDVVDVQAMGMAVLGKTEDIANARITFANGCVANITASRLAMNPMRRVQVFSPDSYVNLDFDKNHAMIVRKKSGFTPGSIPVDQLRTRKPDQLKSFVFSDLCTVEELTCTKEDPLTLELESFVQSVRSHSDPEVNGPEALKSMKIADRILKCIAQNRWNKSR